MRCLSRTETVVSLADVPKTYTRGKPDFVLDSVTPDVTISGMKRVNSGDRVVSRFPKQAIHLFDSETGDALKSRSLEDVDSVEMPA